MKASNWHERDRILAPSGYFVSAAAQDQPARPDYASNLKVFLWSSLLLLVVLAGILVAGRLNAIEAPAARLLCLLFGSQWLLSVLDLCRGKSSLFARRAYLACNGVFLTIGNLIAAVRTRRLDFILPDAERTSLLFWIVKLIFIPFMVSIACKQVAYFTAVVSHPNGTELLSFTFLFTFWLVIIDLLDTSMATLGYTIESEAFNNTVRSVDTSLVGWAAALCCYPPCWLVTCTLFPLNTSPYFPSPPGSAYDYVMRLLIIVLLTVFTAATFNLNLHFSNLCHRGLVTNGMYGIVRHPAYSCKLLAWGLILIYAGGATFSVWLSFFFWIGVYVLRAITEERHLGRVDPEYVEYCRRVRFRFIPGLL